MLQLGELKQAISDYRIAVKLQPGNADALNDLGVGMLSLV
jgi:Tfp pilus assembly protein PilF